MTTFCGVPGNFLRSSSFWVVTPTGQLLVWQMRAMMQPSAIMAIVPKLKTKTIKKEKCGYMYDLMLRDVCLREGSFTEISWGKWIRDGRRGCAKRGWERGAGQKPPSDRTSLTNG